MSFDFKKMLQENIRESRDVQEEISIKDSFQKTSVDLVLLGKQGRYMPHLANENISIELKESLLLEICTELFETQEYKIALDPNWNKDHCHILAVVHHKGGILNVVHSASGHIVH